MQPYYISFLLALLPYFGQYDEYFSFFLCTYSLPSASSFFLFYANHIAFFRSANDKSSKNIRFFLHASQPYVHVTNSAEACITSCAVSSEIVHLYRRILSIASSKKRSLLYTRLMQSCYYDIYKKRRYITAVISLFKCKNVPLIKRFQRYVPGYRCFRYNFFRVEEFCWSLRNYIATCMKTLS